MVDRLKNQFPTMEIGKPIHHQLLWDQLGNLLDGMGSIFMGTSGKTGEGFLNFQGREPTQAEKDEIQVILDAHDPADWIEDPNQIEILQQQVTDLIAENDAMKNRIERIEDETLGRP